MALLMEPGSEPKTQSEIDDLDAIAALKHSSALELKEDGNRYVKLGKKHYGDAIDCYSRAIGLNVLCDLETSVLYSNRSHVNNLVGNYRRALTDAEEAIKLCPSNVKAEYRASKASLSLNLLDDAHIHCENALKHDPDNEEIKKLLKHIGLLKVEKDEREAEVSKVVCEAKKLLKAIEHRDLKLGPTMFGELIQSKKPTLDSNDIIHWPVLLLYPETMSSDFIEDFSEMDIISNHLDEMFSEGSPALQWDHEKRYTREAIELYYEAGFLDCRSKNKVLSYLLEGTIAVDKEINGDDLNPDESGPCYTSKIGAGKWVKVQENRRLYDVLKEPGCVISGIPVFYVVSKRSSFYVKFVSGKWHLPQIQRL